MHHTIRPLEKTSVLATLRTLLPDRKLQLHEALRIAELHANRLLTLRDALHLPIAAEIVSGLPGVAVDYDPDMPASGASDWDSRHRHWVITLRASEPDTRQRFTLLHEYKHIIDHGHPGISTGNNPGHYAPAELVADYFAACVLMPKRLVKAMYFGGATNPSVLASAFEVSESAMRVRLRQLGLTRAVDIDQSEAHPRQTPSAAARHGRYRRSLSRNRTKHTTTGVPA